MNALVSEPDTWFVTSADSDLEYAMTPGTDAAAAARIGRIHGNARAMTDLTLDVVVDDAGLADLRGVWADLSAADPDPNVFLTWPWATTWWRHFGAGHDDRELHIVVVRDGATVVGLAPLFRSRSRHRAAGLHRAPAPQPRRRRLRRHAAGPAGRRGCGAAVDHLGRPAPAGRRRGGADPPGQRRPLHHAAGRRAGPPRRHDRDRRRPARRRLPVHRRARRASTCASRPRSTRSASAPAGSTSSTAASRSSSTPATPSRRGSTGW